MKAKAKIDITFKDGFVIRAGTSCELNPHAGDRLIEVTPDNDTPIHYLRYTNASKYFAGFKKCPAMKTIQKYVYDSVCPTVTGVKVEPDGHDQYGWPSWLLALGLI